MARTYMQVEAQALARRAEIHTLNRAIWRRNDKIARLRQEKAALKARLDTALDVIRKMAATGLPPHTELAEVLQERPKEVKMLLGPVRLTEADRVPV